MEKTLKENKINAINFMKDYRNFCKKQRRCSFCEIYDECISAKDKLTDSEILRLVEIIEKSKQQQDKNERG